MAKATVELEVSDLRYIRNAMDSAMSEIEAAVADGDVDECVMIELSDAYDIVDSALRGAH